MEKLLSKYTDLIHHDLVVKKKITRTLEVKNQSNHFIVKDNTCSGKGNL